MAHLLLLENVFSTSHLASWRWLVGLVIIAATKVLYNIYFHPLSKYPGPRLYAASSIPIALAQLRGNWHTIAKDAHDRYGPVVRLSPNELSFISKQAWQDIYARRNGKPALPRDRKFFNDMLVEPQSITMMNDADHSRLRRALNPAFSTRALQGQEPILQANVDLLMKQLQARGEKGISSDLRTWYNYTTFDLIGDLAFGENFDCLATSRFHEWVELVLDHFYTSTLLHVVHRFSPLHKVLAMLLPASLMEKRRKHSEMALEKIRRRTSQISSERNDFAEHLMRAVGEGTIISAELDSQATILILAGSETTSIALTYATYFLMTHRDALERLMTELRANFSCEDDIDILSLNRLEYLQAILQESLRCQPPIANGFPRQTPKDGAIVDGHVLPAGVSVNVHQWAAFQSSDNFSQPEKFIPERWLGDARFLKDNLDACQPFSVGPRNCIGKKFAYDSMKLILSRLLWRFDLEFENKSDKTNWLQDQAAFASFHPPSLNVVLQKRA
ncbi:hypothetical protein N7509_000264 [Penicillium cosmopolitanum]|uniref:Cytochrome P450 monooxygenase n=1 Tax=Penicillium cosmopolitanum TaxID=1131564 RepID=A0A9W9WAF0_9EURO|nr:uncharacterized protein N7509_000264 [Penicillium cosmopolitanum]KAJ5413637.1 hypothetical protein N7509_000264 [Penicillium cosmopolitanum]